MCGGFPGPLVPTYIAPGTLACIAHHTHSTTQQGRKVCCVGVPLAWLHPGEPFVFVIFICSWPQFLCMQSICLFFRGKLLLSFDVHCDPAGAGSLLKLFEHTVAEATVLCCTFFTPRRDPLPPQPDFSPWNTSRRLLCLLRPRAGRGTACCGVLEKTILGRACREGQL